VTYQARDLLRDCLQSLYQNTRRRFEVIVVDNGSKDGVREMLAGEFPAVKLIENESNAGFTKPMNQALRLGRGRYLIQLNPDTLVLPEALDRLANFLDHNPEIGICGPKVLNQDLTMQKQCRRGEARPWAVITYFLGFSELFPHSRLFGQYLMSFYDEDQAHPVAAVSGSCMAIRRALLDQIGYLDERFFAYQEDSDLCFRARQAGWKVYYQPQAQIIHYGGRGGSKVESERSLYEWHKSYYLYYKKNLSGDYFFLLSWLYYLAMLVKYVSAVVANRMRKLK
jgi:hypothetical protein